MKTLLILLLSLAQAASAQTAAVSDSMRVYYVGRPVGWERYSLSPGDSGYTYSADLLYVDRGRTNHLEANGVLARNFEVRQIQVWRATDAARTQVFSAALEPSVASIGGATLAEVKTLRCLNECPHRQAYSQYLPASQHLLMYRYGKSAGMSFHAYVAKGEDDQIHIRREGTDTVQTSSRTILTRYAIDGFLWGTEYLWLDEQERMAAFAAAGGGLSFKEIRASLIDHAPEIMAFAARAAVRDLARLYQSIQVSDSGSVALVGATLIDGTVRPQVADATVIVSHGKIVSAGPRLSTPVPDGLRVIDVRGKTIMPGLWDMHAHLHQAEWIPVYLAAGVTTVRDMGNELPFITELRAEVNGGRIAGPRILAAASWMGQARTHSANSVRQRRKRAERSCAGTMRSGSSR